MNNVQIVKDNWNVNILNNDRSENPIPHFHTINHITNAYKQENVKTLSPKPKENPEHVFNISKETQQSSTLYAAFDGSCKEGSAGSAVLIMGGTNPSIKLKARPLGEQTSATAEIYALYLLLKNAPPNSPLIIFGDNLNTLSLLEGRAPNRTDERIVIQELKKRIAPTTPLHIYSHPEKKIAKNPKKWKPFIEEQQQKLGIHYNIAKTMNTIVDNMANKARELPLPTNEERAQFYSHNPTVYIVNNILTPDCPRKLLKKEYVGSFPPSTMKYKKEVHLSVKQPGLYSFCLRLMHDILPLNYKVFTGGSKLKRYESPHCKNCNLQADETKKHMLIDCPAYQRIREQAIERHKHIIKKHNIHFPLEWNEQTAQGMLENPPRKLNPKLLDKLRRNLLTHSYFIYKTRISLLKQAGFFEEDNQTNKQNNKRTKRKPTKKQREKRHRKKRNNHKKNKEKEKQNKPKRKNNKTNKTQQTNQPERASATTAIQTTLPWAPSPPPPAPKPPKRKRKPPKKGDQRKTPKAKRSRTDTPTNNTITASTPPTTATTTTVTTSNVIQPNTTPTINPKQTILRKKRKNQPRRKPWILLSERQQRRIRNKEPLKEKRRPRARKQPLPNTNTPSPSVIINGVPRPPLLPRTTQITPTPHPPETSIASTTTTVIRKTSPPQTIANARSKRKRTERDITNYFQPIKAKKVCQDSTIT